MQKITEEEFNEDPALWQKTALDEPVVIEAHGVPKLYLLSKEVFDSLYKDSRKAMHVSELSGEDLEAILESEMDPEHDHLNALLEDDE